MMTKNYDDKKVLGLDIGTNSIGFSFLSLSENDGNTTFKELVSNSIIFSESSTAEERRNARASRRLNERKRARKRYTKKVFIKYAIADDSFLSDTTNYLNTLSKSSQDVYRLREVALEGRELSKEEFLFCVYSILTHRGYSNMFSSSSEDGVINENVVKNRAYYEDKKLLLPSKVITLKRDTLELTYQNIPVRNKKDSYENSLDRAMHKEEFLKVVLSQKDNQKLFSSEDTCHAFIDELIDENIVNSPFYQRPLKSFESMVEYCAFYDKFNPKGSYKKIAICHYQSIELTLRQKIDNHKVSNNKSGEILPSSEVFTSEEINKIIAFWIDTPSSNEINGKNIFKSAGFKDLAMDLGNSTSQIIVNITAHRALLELLKKYEIDFKDKHHTFYNEALKVLSYYKNDFSRKEHIKKLLEKLSFTLPASFITELTQLEHIDGFASFSLEFTQEVLHKIADGKTFHESLEDLGYFSKYIEMPQYDYLPPLEPTKKDIEWLKTNVQSFQEEHLFYQPLISPKVKRVISVLRKLINELIKNYGQIDEIRIETAKEMNSKSEEERIKKHQSDEHKKNKDAEKLLKDENVKISGKNILIAKLLIEQHTRCFYSGEPITLDEALNNEYCEVEHFIPRSTIWINAFKNKILVKKKYNQNKGSQNPVSYLKSISQWENFQKRVESSSASSSKKAWLSNEENIQSVMSKELWQERYLNDTRSATRIIQKYLNHYLFPSDALYKKGESRHIFSVSGGAISELKYIWGIEKIMPKDSEGKKDRSTNYHHTLDAFTIALCSNSAITTLHNFFIKKENPYKTQAEKAKLQLQQPHSSEGVIVEEYLKKMVTRYEEGSFLVCPYHKKPTSAKGFKDGNIKLYVTQISEENPQKIVAEMEKVAIDSSLLIKTVNGFPKACSDTEARKKINEIQQRLDPIKQKKIINALEVYVENLLALRLEIASLNSNLKSVYAQLKNSKKSEVENEKITLELDALGEKKKLLESQQESMVCSFATKKGKLQIVKSLKLYKEKVEKSKADVIIFPNREVAKIERLSVKKFEDAKQSKEPFNIKMNESTLYVELFNTIARGQAVGLSYFSSIANNIPPKMNGKFESELEGKKSNLKLYKNDILKVNYLKEGCVKYFVFNGGGNVAGGNNKLTIKNINNTIFKKIDKKGKEKTVDSDNITPNKSTIVSVVKIDFFGNICEI